MEDWVDVSTGVVEYIDDEVFADILNSDEMGSTQFVLISAVDDNDTLLVRAKDGEFFIQKVITDWHCSPSYSYLVGRATEDQLNIIKKIVQDADAFVFVGVE